MDIRGDFKDEYLDSGENMRQFGNIRFAQMTLFMAMTAGLLAVIYQNTAVPENFSLMLKFGGIIVTFVFWIMDARAMAYWNHYRARAVTLEKILGYEQYSKAPANSIMSTTNAIRLLYLVIFIFWVVAILFRL